ncbi:hypothetical protein DFH27DRAFT_560109 [Peziza echinospora]|nr:hypothetical protein DFH27DRAFT_560109 [Peziza echinospora]
MVMANILGKKQGIWGMEFEGLLGELERSRSICSRGLWCRCRCLFFFIYIYVPPPLFFFSFPIFEFLMDGLLLLFSVFISPPPPRSLFSNCNYNFFLLFFSILSYRYSRYRPAGVYYLSTSTSNSSYSTQVLLLF